MKKLLIPVFFLLNGCVLPAFAQHSGSGALGKLSAKVKIAHPEVPRMPAKELVQLIRKKADIIIVDTQSADGYAMWHIPSAINIAYDSMADPADRQMNLLALPTDKQIVIYCLCEEGSDSAKVALELRDLGYDREKIKVLEGGLVLWDEKGYPIEKQTTAD